MKKLIFNTLIVCAFLFLFVSCTRDERFVPNPAQEENADYPVEFLMRTEPSEGIETVGAATRAADDSIDDINLYAYNDKGISRHFYGLSSAIPSMTLPGGLYRIYTIANAGEDLGEMTENELLQLRTPVMTDMTEFYGDRGFYMSGRQTVHVAGPTRAELTVTRLAAKVNMTIRIDDALKDAYLVDIIPVYAPSSCSVFSNNRLANGEPCLSVPWIDITLFKFRKLSSEYYLYENTQGVNDAITDPKDRIESKVPALASYVAISILKDDVLYDYKVYLGGNTTTDFNVRRNTNYHYDVTIVGTNPNDLRLSKTEITFWAGGKEMAINYNYYYNGFYWLARTAYSELVLTTENYDPDTEYTVSFNPIAGTFKSDWEMAYLIDPDSPLPTSYKPIAPEERIVIHKGNGTTRVKFRFSNYEGYQNYNTGDNDFEFHVRTRQGIGRTVLVSTNQNKWKK